MNSQGRWNSNSECDDRIDRASVVLLLGFACLLIHGVRFREVTVWHYSGHVSVCFWFNSRRAARAQNGGPKGTALSLISWESLDTRLNLSMRASVSFPVKWNYLLFVKKKKKKKERRKYLQMGRMPETVCRCFHFIFILAQINMQNQNAICRVGGVSSPYF